MTDKEYYILYFDCDLSDDVKEFSDTVQLIINELYFKRFRNKSFRISKHGLLIVTNKNIQSSYPTIEHHVEEIIYKLRNEIAEFDYEYYVFIPDYRMKNQLNNKLPEITNYLNK